MESSIWGKILRFIYTSYTKRFKESISGLVMGYLGGIAFLWPHIPAELVHTWIGVWTWVKTVFFAFSSSLATSYAALIIDNYKTKKNVTPQKRRKGNKTDRAA